MDINEALQYAKKCKDDGVVSTSGKALIALYDEVNRLNELRADEQAEARWNDRD